MRKNRDNLYKGTVDSFMSHCANLDVDELYNKCNKRESLEYIMKECNCDESEASEIYNQIAEQEVKESIESLIRDGLVQVVGYNENGEELFGLTELGKSVQTEVKNREN
jgi:predicted transcriptional regulator with HTH domain